MYYMKIYFQYIFWHHFNEVLLTYYACKQPGIKYFCCTCNSLHFCNQDIFSHFEKIQLYVAFLFAF